MNPLIVVHPRSFLPFLIGSALFSLSALYFGGIFRRIALFWFLLFFLDVTLLILNAVNLRYSQDFGSGHLSKGENIEYALRIDGPAFLPVPGIELEFSRIHVRRAEEMPPQSFSLGPGGSRRITRTIHTELRGIYTMGLSRLSLKSLSGMVSLNLSIWSRTFYIYPRLLKHHTPLGKHRSTGGRGVSRAGDLGDYHTFAGLREYRPGEDLHLICWPRFIQTGIPYLRNFESRGGSLIHVYLDRRDPRRTALCEDTVIEAALALVYTAMASGQRVMVHGFPGWHHSPVETAAEFDRLYKSTLFLEFDAAGLPDFRTIAREGALYLVSAIPDLSLLDEGFWSHRPSAHLVAVTEGMAPHLQTRVRTLLAALGKGALEVTEVAAGRGLEEDLTCMLSC